MAMTSLSRQLEGLRTAVSTQLGVERPRVSLLFDREESGKLYVEDVLKIGQIISSELEIIELCLFYSGV